MRPARAGPEQLQTRILGHLIERHPHDAGRDRLRGAWDEGTGQDEARHQSGEKCRGAGPLASDGSHSTPRVVC